MLQFKRAQVLSLLDLKPDTLRFWKQVLSPIGRRDGRADDYSFSELISLAVVARAVKNLSITVSFFKPIAENLFNLIDQELGRGPPYGDFCLTATGFGFVDAAALESEETYVVVKLDNLIADVQRRMEESQQSREGQFSLPLREQPRRQTAG